MKRAKVFGLAMVFWASLICVCTLWAQDPVNLIYESYSKLTPLKGLAQEISMDKATQVQKALVEMLQKDYGKPVGYKAGLTNPKAQEAFGVKEPVLGVLLEKMLLKSGAKLKAQFGARPVTEGDLIVRVGDEKINTAKTPEEAMAFIDQIIPFIELPDLIYAPDVKMNGPMIVAINVGARLGVMGEPISVQNPTEWIERLRGFKLTMLNEKEEVIAEGSGSALMGDPLKVVLWIRDALKARGTSLKKGDLLSLGSITKMMPPQPNSVLKARYLELDPKGALEVKVQFE